MQNLKKIGASYRDVLKLSLADYFSAGGNSIEHYNALTGKGIELRKLTNKELFELGKKLVLQGKKINVTTEMKKSELISELDKVVKAS